MQVKAVFIENIAFLDGISWSPAFVQALIASPMADEKRNIALDRLQALILPTTSAHAQGCGRDNAARIISLRSRSGDESS